MAEENLNNVASENKEEVKASEENSGKSVASGKRNDRNSTQNNRRFSRDNSRGKKEDDQFEEKVVKISRVAKTVKGGKRVRFTALVAVGDGKGHYGYGLGKSNEVPDSIKKAIASAKRNILTLKIAKDDSVTHSVMGHFGATKVFLKPAPSGTGLVAGGAVRTILELAGIKNVYSKIYGSRTQANVIKATVDGLSQLKSYSDVLEKRYDKVPTEKLDK